MVSGKTPGSPEAAVDCQAMAIAMFSGGSTYHESSNGDDADDGNDYDDNNHAVSLLPVLLPLVARSRQKVWQCREAFAWFVPPHLRVVQPACQYEACH